jgi:hypothetical protein
VSLPKEGGTKTDIVVSTPEQDQEKQLRRALDEVARRIGRSAVNHLKEMYPAALSSVPKNAELSLTNFVRNQINLEMRPVIRIAMKH